MGYTTEFFGAFWLDRPLAAPQIEYLRRFAGTRRMGRDTSVLADVPDPWREAVSLPLGEEGGYFVAAGGVAGQEPHPSIINRNKPPSGQPSPWCQWVPTEDGAGIQWDGGEKFYFYAEWLEYIIEHFLSPWGYVLSGEVRWAGEDPEDEGTIRCQVNIVSVLERRS